MNDLLADHGHCRAEAKRLQDDSRGMHGVGWLVLTGLPVKSMFHDSEETRAAVLVKQSHTPKVRPDGVRDEVGYTVVQRVLKVWVEVIE